MAASRIGDDLHEVPADLKLAIISKDFWIWQEVRYSEDPLPNHAWSLGAVEAEGIARILRLVRWWILSSLLAGFVSFQPHNHNQKILSHNDQGSKRHHPAIDCNLWLLRKRIDNGSFRHGWRRRWNPVGTSWSPPGQSNSDRIRTLSGNALAALQEFYSERKDEEQSASDLTTAIETGEKLSMNMFKENWNASQFWVSSYNI